MLGQGCGKIINTASMASLLVPHPQKQAAYNASKAAGESDMLRPTPGSYWVTVARCWCACAAAVLLHWWLRSCCTAALAVMILALGSSPCCNDPGGLPQCIV